MVLSPVDFKQHLRTRVQARAWREHPWFKAFFGGELTRDQVRLWHEQRFYVTGQAQESSGRRAAAPTLFERSSDETSALGVMTQPPKLARCTGASRSSRW